MTNLQKLLLLAIDKERREPTQEEIAQVIKDGGWRECFDMALLSRHDQPALYARLKELQPKHP
jgi:hypothetical protein